MAECYAEVAKQAAAIWEGRSPEAALLLLTRNLPALHLILGWLPQGMAPVDAADAYRDLLWNGGKAISAWLPATERITLCQVTPIAVAAAHMLFDVKLRYDAIGWAGLGHIRFSSSRQEKAGFVHAACCHIPVHGQSGLNLSCLICNGLLLLDVHELLWGHQEHSSLCRCI